MWVSRVGRRLLRCTFWLAIALATALTFCVLGQEAEIPLPEGAIARLGLGWTGWGDRAIAFFPEGKLLAIATSIGIELHGMDTLELVQLLQVHTEPAMCVAFSPNGKYMAVAMGTRVEVRDAGTLELARCFPSYTGYVTRVSEVATEQGHVVAVLSPKQVTVEIQLLDLEMIFPRLFIEISLEGR